METLLSCILIKKNVFQYLPYFSTRFQVTTEQSIKESEDEEYDGRRSKSLTENIRNVDIGKSNLDIIVSLANFDKNNRYAQCVNIYLITNWNFQFPLPFARKSEGNLPLIYITLHQPNLYYWKKKSQKNVQVSLFFQMLISHIHG